VPVLAAFWPEPDDALMPVVAAPVEVRTSPTRHAEKNGKRMTSPRMPDRRSASVAGAALVGALPASRALTAVVW